MGSRTGDTAKGEKVELRESPEWLQNLITDKALGFLEAEEQGDPVRVENVTEESAALRVGEFRYTAHRQTWCIT